MRALIIGAVLTVGVAQWAFYSYMIAMGDSWTGASLFRGPVFVLFCLVIANLALRALRLRFHLDQRELLIVYTMVVMGAAINGVGGLAYLVPAIASIYHYSEAFGFQPFIPYTPKHLVIHDPRVIQAFHTGGATVWSVAVLREWAGPVLWWSALIFALIFAVLCVQVLVRKQWIEHERLTFPMAYVPLAMTEGGGRAMKANRLFWLGFALLAAAHLLNGLATYYPALPHLQLRGVTQAQLLRVWPWSLMNWLHISYDPFIISIAYLVNLDVSLSVWLFYVIYKLSELGVVVLGLRDPGSPPGRGRYPLMDEQGVGAFIGMAVVLMWTSRRRLAEAARAALQGWRRGENEMLSYRAAIVGAGLAIAFMLWFMVKMGLAFGLAVPTLALILIFCVVLSRVVAEAGYVNFTPENGAGETVLFSLGERNVSVQNQTALAWLSTMDQFYSDSSAPQQLNAMKLGEESRMPARHVLAAVVGGAIIALAADWAAQLSMYYHYGATSGKLREYWPRMGWQTFNFAKSYYDWNKPPDWMTINAMLFGVGFITLLAKLRAVFYWFPLHPAGYLICGTPAARFIWIPFFIGWLIKLMTVRYGGLRLYRRLMPFFLGVIVGDNVGPGVWTVYCAIVGRPAR